jgi:hypothetical protein
MLFAPPGTFMPVVRARPLIPSLDCGLASLISDNVGDLLVASIQGPQANPFAGDRRSGCLIAGEDVKSVTGATSLRTVP